MVLRATTQLKGSNGNRGPHPIVRPAAIIAKSAGTLLKNGTGAATVKITKSTSLPAKKVTLKALAIPAKKKIAEPVKKIVVKPLVNNSKVVPVKKKSSEPVKKVVSTKPAAKKIVKSKKMDIIPVKKTN
jgi:hypothetical protein